MDEIDQIGRRAAGLLVADVKRRVDVEDALRRVHDQPATVISLDPDEAPRRWTVQIAAAAVAVVVLVAGGVVLSRRDDSRRLAPVATTDDTVAATTPSTVAATAPISTTSPPTTAEPTSRTAITVDSTTPTLEGEVVASMGRANTHSWIGVVTADARIFLAQVVDGATYSEAINGQFVDTHIAWPDQTGQIVAASDSTPAVDVVLTSDEYSVLQCASSECPRTFWSGGGRVIWNPVVQTVEDSGYRVTDHGLVSVLEPGGVPVTAWLDCGGCQVIGSDATYVYTLGSSDGNTAWPAVVVRRFAFADLFVLHSTVPSSGSVDALADWPAPPDDVPSLDDVPMMLPSITGAIRTEHADDSPGLHDYVQTWFGEGPGGVAMTITTNVAQPAGLVGDAVDVAPWDQAVFTRTSGGYESLHLVDPSGSVDIWSRGLTRDQVLAVAVSLHAPLGDAPGWGVGQLPAGLTKVHEGWYLGAASRMVTWSDDTGASFELWIVHGVPLGGNNPLAQGVDTQIVDVGGGPGASYDLQDGRLAVVWTPLQDLTVLLAVKNSAATVEDLVDMARSVAVVDEATWLSATAANTSTDDGCNSFFC